MYSNLKQYSFNVNKIQENAEIVLAFDQSVVFFICF